MSKEQKEMRSEGMDEEGGGGGQRKEEKEAKSMEKERTSEEERKHGVGRGGNQGEKDPEEEMK